MNEHKANHEPSTPDRTIAAREVCLARSQAFSRFEQWMDGELHGLVTRWEPFAAPAAGQNREFGPSRGRI